MGIKQELEQKLGQEFKAYRVEVKFGYWPLGDEGPVLKALKLGLSELCAPVVYIVERLAGFSPEEIIEDSEKMCQPTSDVK